MPHFLDNWNKGQQENNKDRNKRMLIGITIGVLLYMFTGNMALVILGMLFGLIFNVRKN